MEGRYAVTVVLAAEGYPASPVKGAEISSPDLDNPEKILHAGTTVEEDGAVRANGGRVLNVLGGHGSTLHEARGNAYVVLDEVAMDGGFYRYDIGLPAAQERIRV